MSCFWDALIKNIKHDDIYDIFKFNKINPLIFVNNLKLNNKLVDTIYINDQLISKKQQNENYEHIKNYDVNTISNGYLCSTADPFLILIADIFSITINNKFLNKNIIYKPICFSRYTINISNDNGHMK